LNGNLGVGSQIHNPLLGPLQRQAKDFVSDTTVRGAGAEVNSIQGRCGGCQYAQLVYFT